MVEKGLPEDDGTLADSSRDGAWFPKAEPEKLISDVNPQGGEAIEGM